ncbi:MAG: hypothetical protein J6B04_03530, partial [Clostridia bacterium]|nr:hypothetical protein [Clostridia bacterium]
PAPTPVAKMEEVETQAKKPSVQSLVEEEGENPFATFAAKKVEQPAVWDTVPKAAGVDKNNLSSLTDDGKKNVFAKLLRLLRQNKKGVLFSLCMDLDNFFEGEKLILTTKTDAVYRTLNKEENKKTIAELLSELGVFDHEVRKVGETANKTDAAINQLKNNFSNLEIK